MADCGYDELDRLTFATGAGLLDAYAYDASGNRTQRRLGTVTETTQMQPTSNRIASVSTPSPSSWSPPGMPFMTVTATTGVPRSYSYDAMGNVLGDGKNTLRYDDLGFLTEAKTPTGNYGYLASISGLRLAKGLAQPSWGIPLEYQTFYVYDPQGRLMAEIDKAGQVQKEYLYLGTALGEAPAGVVATTQVDGQTKPTPLQLYYVMADHLGTPRLIENMSQQAVWTWKPDEPFGDSMPVQKVGNSTLEFNLRFPGQYFDAETALSYNWNRYYGSKGGAYWQSDLLGLAGGWNSFAYVGANPANLIDPEGLKWVYSQSTGQMVNIDSSGVVRPLGTGYAGNGPGLNNPTLQDLKNIGPLPRGDYTIGPQYVNSNTGPGTMNLTPSTDNQMFGRDKFRIHGDNARGDYSASEGCIILPKWMRDQINSSSDKNLQVIK